MYCWNCISSGFSTGILWRAANILRFWIGFRTLPPALFPFEFSIIVDLAHQCLFNSLAPGGFENIFQNVFFKLISWIDTLSNSCETALRSMPQNPSDDKSTLVQVMAWCRQAASHYLSQCCPRSLSPYGVTRPQWVKWSRASWLLAGLLTVSTTHAFRLMGRFTVTR